MLRFVFKLRLRQAEGFLRSILRLVDIDLKAPDHTTLSRRSQHLDVRLDRVASTKRIHPSLESRFFRWARGACGRGKRGMLRPKAAAVCCSARASRGRFPHSIAGTKGRSPDL